MQREANQENTPSIDSIPRKLHVGLLQGINLHHYPAFKTHYLAYALQFGLKLPSVKTMSRSEARNKKKSGEAKADQNTGRRGVRRVAMKVKHILPMKFGPQPCVVRIRKRGPKVVYPKRELHYRKGHVYPPRKSISLPAEIVKKTKTAKASEQKLKTTMSPAPEWAVLKAERTRFLPQIQKYRAQSKVQDEGIPNYFIKRRQRQKVRRQEKHELIKNNRKALVAIFGDAIFKRGWPVSRKEIKLALGLEEEEHDKAAFLGEFLEMVKKTTENGCSNSNSKVKMNLGPNEVSRMVRISSPKREEESTEPTAYSIEEVNPKVPQFTSNESDFPSLEVGSSTSKKK